MFYFPVKRKSYIEIGNIYFWTATINSWYKLLQHDELKQMIVDSLSYLHSEGKIDVYGFVIMPNHIHLIWRINELNGKETAQGSFLKMTAHAFKKYLLKNDAEFLKLFKVEAHNKQYEFWQRDSLAFHLTQRATAIQKIEYIHNNPLADHWRLCNHPAKYKYSSANYYETQVDEFGFMTHLLDGFS